MSRKIGGLALKSIVCLNLMFLGFSCYAKDFGKVANTFEIKEEGFVAMMKRKLSGVDMEKENEKMQSLAKERVENPTPVPFIINAEKTRTFFFDPTYTLIEDILLPNGQVLHKAGTRINPLNHMSLNRRMFFINAADEKQLIWLKNKLAEFEKPHQMQSNGDSEPQEAIENRIILTKGKIMEVQKELGRTIYFDQSGELTSKFGIKAVPAIALEEDKKIKITEINIEEEMEEAK